MNHRNPVVLVHGIIRTSSVFRILAPYLIQQGWSVYLIDLTPNNATLPLEEMAAQVRDFVKLSIFAHAFMVVHPRSLQAIAAALSEPIKRDHVKHARQPLPTLAPQKLLHDGGKT
jgi:triacylglycerol esterase/lipase EstA (alpha/beta hydrolase family)